jgi:hypothetical protein
MAQVFQPRFAPISFALLTAIGFGSLTSSAVAEDQTHVFKPARGVSLDIGSKKVVGVYRAHAGLCELTVMVGDLPDADGHVEGASTRINVPVKAGATQRVYTTDGRLVEFACSLTTNLMTARALEQTALVAK